MPPTAPRARKRISTGLAGLDAQLGGGIPDGSVIFLVGEPMNAFELFGFHFATASSSCVYVARDLLPLEIQEGVRRIGGNPKDLILLGDEDPLPELKEGQRAVIEGFADFVERHGWDASKEWLLDLREKCLHSGATILIMATAGLLDEGIEKRIKSICDGALELGFDRQGFALYPFLKVTKMRGVSDASRFLLFKETPKGLFMENTRRVF